MAGTEAADSSGICSIRRVQPSYRGLTWYARSCGSGYAEGVNSLQTPLPLVSHLVATPFCCAGYWKFSSAHTPPMFQLAAAGERRSVGRARVGRYPSANTRACLERACRWRKTRGILTGPDFDYRPWGVVDDLLRGRVLDRQRSDPTKLGTTFLNAGFTAFHESVRAPCHLRRAQRNAGCTWSSECKLTGS